MTTILSFDYDGFVDYYLKRKQPNHDAWSALQHVAATNPGNQYHVVFAALDSISPIAAYNDPMPFLNHMQFQDYIFESFYNAKA